MRHLVSRIRRRLFRPSETIDGYGDPELVDLTFRKTVAYDPQEAWPGMAGVSSVLDFGGGCGQHYKLAKRQSPDIHWAVVETSAMVRRASELATDKLRFFTDIESAAGWLGAIDVMHSNSALQYHPDPVETLQRLCSLKATQMLWDRLALSQSHIEREEQISLLGDNGPGKLSGLKEKRVRYVRTKIPERLFLQAHAGYALLDRGPDWFRFRLRQSE